MDPRREIAFVMHLEKSGFSADKAVMVRLSRHWQWVGAGLASKICEGKAGWMSGCVGRSLKARFPQVIWGLKKAELSSASVYSTAA